MSSEPASSGTKSKSKEGVRKFLRAGFNNVFRSRSRSPSRQSVGLPSSQPHSPSSAPNEAPDPTTVSNLASPSVGAVAAASQQSVLPVQDVNPSINLSPTAIPTTPAEPADVGHINASPEETAPENSEPAHTGPSTPIPPVAELVVTNPADTNSGPATAPSPTTQATKKAGSIVWTGLRAALGALHQNSKLFAPLQSAVGAVISSLDIVATSTQNSRDYEDLAKELTTMSETLTRHMKESRSFRMSNCIANVALSIEQQVQLIKVKRDASVGRRLLEAHNDEQEILGYYRRIESLFRQLQNDANLSILNIVDQQLVNSQLERLKPARMAKYDSTLSMEINRRPCTEGTRITILTGLDDWSGDLSLAPIYWMDGMAGTGKTTIACSFSKRLEERKQLAASFFCTRTSPECRDVSRIVPTIAYQLARYSVPFQSALSEILEADPDISSAHISKQFDRLLKEPLAKVKEAMPDNLAVVIDALDECDSRNGVELVLDTLFEFAADLPLRFFVTSRPEPEIYYKIVSQDQGSRKVLHLHEIEKSLVQADIELYLREELEKFMILTTSQIEQLAQRSGNLFIYAATLVRYIRLGRRLADYQKRLRTALAMTSGSTKKHAEIDALYVAVLKSALDDEELEDEDVEEVRLVLQTVLCVQEPVSVEVIAVLAGLDDSERALSALQPLRSVLHLSESSGLVATLHASFPDFMFDKERSGAFYCDVAEHSQLLSRQCFKTMKERLRFNICGLESSFMPDRRVNGLKERIDKEISPALSYICQYWGDHLQLSTTSDELKTMLSQFLSIRLLFWMEVMNLKGVMGVGAEVLLKAKLWLQAEVTSSDSIRLAEDARNFVTIFAANRISESTPHIYTSLLPFAPKSSTVYKHYWKRTQGLVQVTGGAMERREVAALASWNVGPAVWSVAYSPDGTRVAYGCADGSVGIRNAYDGSLVVRPLEGHTMRVMSVAFSPDGTRFTSGSDDCTIRVWNTQNGTLVAGPFVGHTDEVNSVAFSPNSAHIVSGSKDCTIRVWNSHDGTLALDPFKGHTSLLWSVAYSPDGLRIVSGSKDCTIRVWNAQDGTLVAGPFEGHADEVNSVAFSPDGTHVASGSDDYTIRVWNIRDGTLVASPFEGHTDRVMSVAFSPDGTRIVSGSHDSSIRVWNSQDGTPVAGPFQGHTDNIWSVAFSPDGTRIVSGSEDCTVQVWNAQAGTPASGLVQGHSGKVSSVAFSPDGTRLVSGSADHTIRLWNATDGSPAASLFQGHTGWVNSVVFSPDGSRVVSGSSDCTVRAWNTHDGTIVAGPLRAHTGAVLSVAYSPNSAYVASSSADRTVRVWNSQDGTLLAGPLEGHSDEVRSVAFSPDGTHIVSGSDDLTIRVWSTHQGKLVGGPFKGHTRWVRSVAFSPDGKCIASGSNDRTIRVCDVQDGTLLCGPLRGHGSFVLSVAFSPDSKYVASGSRDRTIRVWNIQDGTLAAGPFVGHTDDVNSVAFSPDGTCIVSSSDDSTIRVWNLHDHPRIISSLVDTNIPSPSVDLAYTHDWVNWTTANDGWITNESRLLLWVPPDLTLPSPCNRYVITPFGSLQVDYTDILLGDRWHECYISE